LSKRNDRPGRSQPKRARRPPRNPEARCFTIRITLPLVTLDHMRDVLSYPEKSSAVNARLTFSTEDLLVSRGRRVPAIARPATLEFVTYPYGQARFLYPRVMAFCSGNGRVNGVVRWLTSDRALPIATPVAAHASSGGTVDA
jgi:hypothetical protein